jgi:hypothetical protein
MKKNVFVAVIVLFLMNIKKRTESSRLRANLYYLLLNLSFSYDSAKLYKSFQ